MGYSLEADIHAARVLENLLHDAWLDERYVGLSRLCSRLAGYRVCVVGASRDVVEKAELIGNVCDRLVVADGVTELVLEKGLEPDIVFTDLDGRWSSILAAADAGSYIVVHSHGDNVYAVRSLVPVLDNVHGTVQAVPATGLRFSSILGGFTDGDRALAATIYCGAREVILVGMRFGDHTSRYSKPWLRRDTAPWPMKRRKLVIGAMLVSLLYRIARARGIGFHWL